MKQKRNRNVSRRRRNWTLCSFNGMQCNNVKATQNHFVRSVRKKKRAEKISHSWLRWLFDFSSSLSSSTLYDCFEAFLSLSSKPRTSPLGLVLREHAICLACQSCHPSAEGLIFNVFSESGVMGLLPCRH